jgi:nitroreductase
MRQVHKIDNGERGKTLYCPQDTAAAIQNILLTAYSLGLGTCWIAFRQDDICRVIKAPDYMRPVALVSCRSSTSCQAVVIEGKSMK